MRIKLLKDWKPNDSEDGYKSGTILDVDKDEALRLIGDDIADRYREPVEPKRVSGADDPDAWKKMVKESVADAVKAATEEARKDNKVDGKAGAHVEVGKNLVHDDPKMGYKSAGEFFRDVMNVGTRRRGLEELPKLKAVTGHSEGIDAEGGFLVPTEFRNQLLERSYANGAVASRAMAVPLQTATMSIPYVDETSRAAGSRSGSIQVYRLGEGAQHTVEKANFGLLTLAAKKLVGAAAFTEELLSDNIMAVESIVTRLLGDEIAFVVDDEMINGTGGEQMLGIVNAGCTISITIEAGQAATTIVYENILKMWARLWPRSRPNAVWFVNCDCLPQLYQMSMTIGAGGVPVYMPAGGISGAQYGTLFGRPVIEIEQCQTLGTAGDIILADMSQYVHATKGGVQAAQSIHLRFDYGETVLRLTLRNDGSPWWRSALTPAHGSNTLSPFITLAARS